MNSPTLAYPIELNGDGIAAVLPHRGEMALLRHLTVLAHNHYVGTARWDADAGLLQGHFPGMPLVPGVLLVEAVAQTAGAGMLTGDAYARSMGNGYIGVLAGIRKCSFKRPVMPGEDLRIEVHSRQMSELAANVQAELTVGGEAVATVEILIVNAPRAAVEERLVRPAPLP